jgi:hypothetical protein
MADNKPGAPTRVAEETREIESDRLRWLVEAQGAAYVQGMEVMADKLATVLAERLAEQPKVLREEIFVVADRISERLAQQQPAALDNQARNLIRDYTILREELSGPAEGSILRRATIRSIVPSAEEVGARIAILTENAAEAVRVAFARDGGGTVDTNPDSTNPTESLVAGGVMSGEAVWVTVPEGAVTGPVTVVLAGGDSLTSKKSFVVLRRKVVAVEVWSGEGTR